jgi:hypothetical protein
VSPGARGETIETMSARAVQEGIEFESEKMQLNLELKGFLQQNDKWNE